MTHPSSPQAVSVVLPTRNRAALLRRAVKSIFEQTYAVAEILVVNDGSTDATRELLYELARTDSRIRAFHLMRPGGVSAARNHGIEQSRGSFVAFLDDDDEWLPHKIEVQLEALRAAPGKVGIVYSPYLRVSGEAVSGAVDISSGRARRELFRHNFIALPSVVVRREILHAVGGFDENLRSLEDWDLWVRIAAVTEFAFVPEPLVRIHSTPGSLTKQTRPLIEACGILADKAVARADVSTAERADWYYALGHALMIGGAPAEGRKLLRQAVRLRPWPPRRLAMAALASWSPVLHGAVSGVHQRVMER